MRRISWLLLFLGVVSAEISLFLPHFSSFFISEDFWQLAFAGFTEDPFIVFYTPYYGDRFWRPLFQLFNWAAWWAFGTDPIGYHALTVFFHSINAMLVAVFCYLVLSVTGAKPGWGFLAATAAGFFFAVHPLASMTTIWFTCFEDLHGLFFLLLSLILLWPGKRGLAALAFFTSMLAFLSKETMFTLPALAFVAGLIRADKEQDNFKGKAFYAFKFAMPCIAALACYMAWRLPVAGGIGGYEKISLAPSFLIPRLASNIPTLLDRTATDILFHHLESGSMLYKGIAACFIVIVGLGIIPALLRSARALAYLCLFFIVTITPLWNASHMLFHKEDRLFYVSLFAASLILCLVLASPRRALIKIFMFAASAALIYFLALASVKSLWEWQYEAEENRTITEAMINEVDLQDADAGCLRYYVTGLGPEDYALDPMIKIHLEEDDLCNSFMLGEYGSFVWKPEGAGVSLARNENEKTPEKALPEVRGKFTRPYEYLVSVYPPDLLFAARHDPRARFYHYENGVLNDVGSELTKLFSIRKTTQRKYNYPRPPGEKNLGLREPYKYLYLPSFSFSSPRIPLQWELSPGLEAMPVRTFGQPIKFKSAGYDPYMISPNVNLPALAAVALEIEMQVESRDYLAPGETEGVLFWMNEEDSDFNSSRQIKFRVKADGNYHRYVFDLERSLAWCTSTTIKRIRLDPISFPGSFRIRRMEFQPSNWLEFRDPDTE